MKFDSLKSTVNRIRNVFEGKPEYECVLTTCTRKTKNPYHADPEKRWLIGVTLQDADGREYTVNFCPNHIKAYFPRVTPEFFTSLRETEKLIRTPPESEVVQ